MDFNNKGKLYTL